MTVFKYYGKIFWRKKLTFLLYMGLFLAISTIIASGISNSPSFEENQVKIGIAGYRGTPVEREFLKFLKKKDVTLIPEDLSFEKEIYTGHYQVIFRLHDVEKGLKEGKKVVDIYTDQRDLLASATGRLADKFFSYLVITEKNGKYDFNAVNKALQRQSKVTFAGNLGKTAQGKMWLDNYFRASAYNIAAVLMTGLGLANGEFRKRSLERRSDISNTSHRRRSLEIFLAQFFIALLVLILQCLMGYLIGWKFITEVKPLPYFLAMSLLAFAILGMVHFIQSVTDNLNVISGLGTVLPLGMSFISGVFVPAKFLPKMTLKISTLFPVTYYLKILENKGGVLTIYSVILLLYGLFFFLLGVYIKGRKLAA